MQMWRKNRIYHEHDEFQRNFPIQIQAQNRHNLTTVE